MSARLLKSGPRAHLTFAPFTIPAPPGAENVEDAATPSAEALSTPGGSPLTDTEQRARKLLESARREAERVCAEARARAAQIEQETYEKGLAAARQTMDEEVQAAAADLRGQLAHTLTELEALYALITSRAERDLVKLALAIARKVVHREVATDADIVLTLARVALERLHPRAVATVLLHPDDFETVNAERQSLSRNNTLEIVADRAVGRGGCIIQSEHGDIDARIEQQFATIERGFFE